MSNSLPTRGIGGAKNIASTGGYGTIRQFLQQGIYNIQLFVVTIVRTLDFKVFK